MAECTPIKVLQLFCWSMTPVIYSQLRNVYNFIYLVFQVEIGQKIGVTLDMDNMTLSFDVDSKYLGIAFTNLPKGQRLYPAVSAVYGHSEVSLLYYGRPLVG